MVIYLERGANDLRMVKLMPLPPRHLLLPEWFTFLVPAYPRFSWKTGRQTDVRSSSSSIFTCVTYSININTICISH